jgi:invasion protein IalB
LPRRGPGLARDSKEDPLIAQHWIQTDIKSGHQDGMSIVARATGRRNEEGSATAPSWALRLALSGLALWGLAVSASPAAAQEQNNLPDAKLEGAQKSFGDWRLRCEVPSGATVEQCALMQTVVAEDHPDLTLIVAVRVVGGKLKLLRVVAPLGVLLLRGLGLKIDSTDMGKASFTRCLGDGCVADVEMDDTLADLLKKGQVATFIIFRTPEEGIGIPVSLQGFSEGLQALH